VAVFILYLLLDEICKDEVIHLTDVKPDPKKANPKVGPSQVAFSPDNRFVFSRNGMHALFLYGLYSLLGYGILVNVF